MGELPQWLITALITATVSVIGAAFGYFGGRRLNRATAGEKDASALEILEGVAAKLAKQLTALTDEIPVWRQKVATETQLREVAEKYVGNARIVQQEAISIVEDMKHLSYLADPDEEDNSVARRFRNIKASASRIAGLQLQD